MPPETHEIAWVLPVTVQVILPIVLVLLTGAGTWMVAKVRAKNERIKQEQDHALAIASQQADFDGRKKAAAMARDKQMYDIQQQIITTLQASQRDSAHREARMDAKFNELYGNLGNERDYSAEWEDWHRSGMPDPPGKPKRRPIPNYQPPATPPGG